MYLCYITTQVFLYYKRPSTVDPPDAPMADRMVTNIRLAEPMTPAPDYRFYATFTWNPPVYPYKNITEYAFTWSKQPEHLYLNRGGGSPVSDFICLFVDNFKLNVKRYLDCFFFLLNIALWLFPKTCPTVSAYQMHDLVTRVLPRFRLIFCEFSSILLLIWPWLFFKN